MANLTNVDFYYGAVLSQLFTKNKEYTISLIERSGEQRVFAIETNKHSYVLRTHKSEGKRDVKTDSYSWTFNLSPKAVHSLQDNYKKGIANVVALVLLESEKLSDSKIIYFTDFHLDTKGIYEEPGKQIGMTVRKNPDKNDYLLLLIRKSKMPFQLSRI